MTRRLASLFSVVTLILGGTTAWCAEEEKLEHLSIRQTGIEHYLQGRTLVEAEDGGLLFQEVDDVYWAVQPKEILKRQEVDKAFALLDKTAIEKKILAELPEGFQVYSTAHYMIIYNTSKPYAQWCAGLYERLYRGFFNYWKRRGVKLEEPDRPLVALIFDSKTNYISYSKAELGAVAGAIVGYYSLRSNRMAMYDLTRTETLGGTQARGSLSLFNKLLSRPEAAPMVATIIHEATHQLAFNSGMQQRYADVPYWLSEGMAVYFETPDLNRRTGWSTIGAVNRNRLHQFHKYYRSRPADSLKRLIQDNSRFLDTKTAVDAYAEAWALTYFLVQMHPKEYAAYVKGLSEKKPMMYDTPEEKIKAFEDAFGDIEKLDVEFIKRISRVK